MNEPIIHGVRRENRLEARVYFLCGRSTTPLWGKNQHPDAHWGEPLEPGEEPCLYTFAPDLVTCPLCQKGRAV